MTEFSLESFSERIHYGKTKDYFQEVLSSYHNGNYRSAVVMLWSVAVCDIVYKLQNLVDLYQDPVAKSILDELTALQTNDPKSASWELKLIEDTHNKTQLLDGSEYENLRYLQKQRHLSAHPTLNADRELHSPNKETVRSLIRNTLEGLLIKPPFYTQKIIDEFLVDIAESAEILNNLEKVQKYVNSRYLNRLKPEVQLSIYRTLWKFVFKLDNDKCRKNRYINHRTLQVIGNQNSVRILEKISGEKDYYSNVSSDPRILNYLVLYLAKNHKIYDLLNEDAKIKIQHHVENTNIGRICGWLLKDSLEQYYQDILSLVESNTYEFEDLSLKFLFEISDTEEWQHLFCRIVSSYYCSSRSYDQADSRFQQAVSPYLELFDKEELIFLVNKIELNRQVYGRGLASEEHKEIKEKIFQLYGEEFDFTPYPHFKSNVT
ncbi:hypothetical protein A0J48_000605 [Sphaerospermopsis aphanizomenoides BCCUSP55]|uniref:hypothetical protein n=1 Tax=Sphaerospermopsis aphanizomenoides TaxID=459663 RepID=UPI001903CF02|nr:hypothetical protein [Sphaerospermopsis aphanizomenoides]MBK1986065.1 hypothetical protein [Sphaerospermopsis aphanizomenoides BCCUSP55]